MKFEQTISQDKIYSHLLHLYQLAKIDNSFVKEEKRYLYALGRKNGVPEQKVDELILNANEVKLSRPESTRDKVIFLYEYIQMMLVDDKLDEREARMCALIAERMGLDKGLVGTITNAIVAAKDEDRAPELSDQDLEFYIENQKK